MAGLTKAQFVSEMTVLTEVSGTDIETSFLRYLNLAGRELWNARMWDERKKEVILTTVAPYATGTVAIANGSTTVTFTGSTLVAGMVGRKLTLGLGGPFYRISTVNTGAGTAVLARAFQEDTVTASAFTIYQDEYDVASDVDVLRSVNMLHSRDRGPLRSTTEAEFDAASYATSSMTIPMAWAPCVDTTAGTTRIRLWPIPDNVYAARVLYLKEWTDLTSDGDLQGLGANKDRLLLYAAVLLAQKIPGAQQATSEAEVAALTERAWRDQQLQAPLVVIRDGFDRVVPWTNTIQIDTTTL